MFNKTLEIEEVCFSYVVSISLMIHNTKSYQDIYEYFAKCVQNNFYGLWFIK